MPSWTNLEVAADGQQVLRHWEQQDVMADSLIVRERQKIHMEQAENDKGLNLDQLTGQSPNPRRSQNVMAQKKSRWHS